MDERQPSESVRSYIKFLKKSFPNIKTTYIFGSYVKGSAHVDSDIDIAVIFNDIKDSFELQVELMKIRRKYDSRIEPHVFRATDFNSSHPLAQEIISTGIEIQ
jgi:predicted nucleotidyltransferase